MIGCTTHDLTLANAAGLMGDPSAPLTPAPVDRRVFCLGLSIDEIGSWCHYVFMCAQVGENEKHHTFSRRAAHRESQA